MVLSLGFYVFHPHSRKEGGHLILQIGEQFLIETRALPGYFDIRGILACNLETMHYRNLGFGMRGTEHNPLLRPESCTIETSFTESLVMFEGVKSLLKFAK